MKNKVESYRSYLNRDEAKELKKASNKRAFQMFFFNWLIIAFAFILVAIFPNIVSVVIALFLLAGRQLGLGILLHECSHRSFFKTEQENDFWGHWLAGMAILVPITFYRPYHFKHHTKTGSSDDPDVGNIRQYPVSKASFVRKVIRDFIGLSGIKMLMAVLVYVLPERSGNAVTLGINQDFYRTRSEALKLALRNYFGAIGFHCLFISVLWLFGVPELYVLWWAAYIFVHPFIIRVRQIGEHGAMPFLSSEDVRDTTRTTYASMFERLIFAPNYVNYHCEHHFLPTVPSYNLPKMHACLKKKGFYKDKPSALVSRGYLGVISAAIK